MNRPTILREKIAQLLFVRLGSNMTPKVEASDDLDRVARLVEQHNLGGLLLFNGGTVAAASRTLSQIQSMSRRPLTIAADMERGLAQQVTDLTTWPHSMAFDALGIGAENEVEKFARLSCAEAKQIGVHISFSPVADIHRNPQNPIIANRAFGTTPERVEELAAAYVRGCHASGMLCCAKHFPGHGNTRDDSHAKLPVLPDSLDELQRTDLRPFQVAIDSGVDMLMTAHVAYPALDPTGTPATLSRPILTELLRESWNYQGAIVSDSLKMDGVKQGGKSEGQLAVQAVSAGVDLLLDVGDVVEVIDALEAVVHSDPEFASRIDSAFEQAWRIKTSAMKSKVNAEPCTEEAHSHALRVARRSLKVLTQRDERARLPIPQASKVGFLLVNPLGDNAYTKTNQIVETFRAFPNATTVEVFGPGTNEADATPIFKSLAACEICVVTLVVKPAAWSVSAIPDWQAKLLNQLCEQVPTVMGALGVAELLDDYEQAVAKIAMFSDVPVCQQAFAEAVMGTGDSM